MHKLLFLLGFVVVFASSCENASEEKKEKVVAEVEEDEQLIEIMPNMYREYFPGKKQIKITGPLDNDGKRHGTWESYYENGQQNSATYYVNGVKNGHSIVYHPNGAVYYYGEYLNDEKTGVWKTFDDKGTMVSEDEF